MSGLSFRRWLGLSATGALVVALVIPATEASASTSSKTVAVPAGQPWTDSGISLPAGSVSLKASGVINVSSGDPQFSETPAGDGPADPTCVAGPGAYSGSWTAPGLPCWSLIGRIGNGAPFYVGNSYQAVIKNPGELYLGVDDETAAFGDNSGSWSVQASWTSSSPSCAYTPTVTFSPNSGPLGTTFTINGRHWEPGGTVTSTLPYGSPGVFTGYQTPTADSGGAFSFKERVGSGRNGPTPPGRYTFTFVENHGGCSLSFRQTFIVTPSVEAYYALGDSYSAGEGVPPIVDVGNCRQSEDGAYPSLFAAKSKHYDLRAFAACSGAVINDVAGKQLSVLRRGPALVTLTAGGNDAGFAPVLLDCIKPHVDCSVKDANESSRIKKLFGPLYNAYLRVKAAAPHLRIIVLTYPQFLTANVSQCAGSGYMSAQEVTWIRARTTQLNNVIKHAAAAAGVQVLDVENAFSGHEICTGSPSATGSWVNGIQFSDYHWFFHPNKYGQQVLADRLLARVG